MRPDFATPTPAPPHKGEGFPAPVTSVAVLWKAFDPLCFPRRCSERTEQPGASPKNDDVFSPQLRRPGAS
ncbi:hypothetical protein BOSEA31B_12221 [Hyphomicrobiales bacterium]|nr:hypothetical protein BOSEA31B_12221 [Hyphomicrobiales bacterium]CAH1698000.1 hypothetical protein BOSEA1005_11045 [Hyphomicrobiales bacterium]CAI0347643.1 hypothetical protein BO1005MUT1_90004 [Hyphomicrobiales bacterium]